MPHRSSSRRPFGRSRSIRLWGLSISWFCIRSRSSQSAWNTAMTSEAGTPRAIGAEAAPMIDISDLHKSYGPIEAVRGVSLTVPRGEAHFIIGPSGCGKSTLLRCINLLEEPTGGRLRVGETVMEFHGGRLPMSVREQARYRARVGMVFQQFHLFPHMTAIENIMEGPRTVKRMPLASAREIAEALLEK